MAALLCISLLAKVPAGMGTASLCLKSVHQSIAHELCTGDEELEDSSLLVARMQTKPKGATPQGGAILLNSSMAERNGSTDTKPLDATPQGGTILLNASMAGRNTSMQTQLLSARIADYFAHLSDLREALQDLPRLQSIWQVLLSIDFVSYLRAGCVVSNAVQQVSPLPSVLRYATSPDGTGDVDAAPLLAMAYGSAQWCFYGLFNFYVTGSVDILVLPRSYSLGVLLGSFYVYNFWKHCHRKDMLRAFWTYCAIASLLSIIEGAGLMALSLADALYISGLISGGVSLVTAVSILSSLQTVVQTRSSACMPWPLVCSSLVSYALWVWCGLVLADRAIVIPSSVGGSTYLLCLLLKLWYPDDLAAPTDKLMARGLALKLGIPPFSRAAEKLSTSNSLHTSCL